MKKYDMIYREIQGKILANRYPQESFLPPELELSRHYQVSRDTIRKALGKLEKAGLIVRQQGRGNQVLKRKTVNFPVSELTSYQELVTQQGLDSRTHTVSIDQVIIDEKGAQLTGFPKLSRVWRVTRQRIVEGEASVLDIDYLLRDVVPNLSRTITDRSIYAHLEQELKLHIAYAQKEITIDTADDRDKILMDLGQDQHVVCIRSKVFLANEQQFQFTESRHKLDKFQFVDFARRTPSRGR